MKGGLKGIKKEGEGKKDHLFFLTLPTFPFPIFLHWKAISMSYSPAILKVFCIFQIFYDKRLLSLLS